MNCSLPGSSVYGIFKARILEQVAVSYSGGGGGGVFLNQRWKNLLCLLHWQADFSPPAPPGKPLEYISLFNPENNQKSASICTNEKKKMEFEDIK